MKFVKAKVIISLLILIITGILVSKLSVESNMEDMLPEESLSLAATEDFQQYFDGDDQVFIVVKESQNRTSRKNYHEEAKLFLETLNSKLVAESYIDSILYKMSYNEVKEFSWAYIDIEDIEILDVEIEQENLENIISILTSISKNGEDNNSLYIENDKQTHYLLIVKPNIDEKDFTNSRMTFYNGIHEHLNKTLSEYKSIDAGITGGAFIQDLEGDTVAFDGFFSTLVITLILIITIVIIFFGSLKLPLLAMYPLMIGGMIAAASAYLIYGSLNMFSISFALLLVGLGIDFAVHLIARYQEERHKGEVIEIAIKHSIKSTGSSIIMGAITTAFAFGTFAFAQFKAFEQMGIISAIGIISLCLMMILLVPVIIYIFDKKQKVHKIKWRLIWLQTITTFNQKHFMAILGGIFLLLVVLLPNVLKFEIQSDLTAVYPNDIPSQKWTQELQSAFDYNPNTIAFYTDNIIDLQVMKTDLEKLDYIDGIDSILDYLPKENDRKLEVIRRLDEFLISKGINYFNDYKLELMTYEDLPKSIQDNFVGKEGKLRAEIIPLINIYNDDYYYELLEDIIEITGKHPAGLPTIMNEVSNLVKNDMTLISGLCIIVTFFVALFSFKNIKTALLTITPLALTLYILIGILPIISIEINIFSIAAFPLIIGIGIDSAIHLIHRLKEPSKLSVAEKVMEIGKPIILTGLTTMIGFGSLANINHPGMSRLGLTVAIGIGISIMLTLIVIPLWFKTK